MPWRVIMVGPSYTEHTLVHPDDHTSTELPVLNIYFVRVLVLVTTYTSGIRSVSYRAYPRCSLVIILSIANAYLGISWCPLPNVLSIPWYLLISESSHTEQYAERATVGYNTTGTRYR